MNFHRANSPEDGEPKSGSVVPSAQYAPATRDPYSSAVGHYYGPGADSGSEFQVDLLEYLRILIKRRWLILSVALAALVYATLSTLMQTPLYTSAVRLQIDRSVAKIVEAGNITPVEGSDLEFMKTQYELLEGRTMAERVASALKLGEDPDFFQPRSFSDPRLREKTVGLSPAFGAAGERQQQSRPAGRRRRRRTWQSRGDPGCRIALGRHHLFRSGSGARAENRGGVRRCLHRVEFGQAIPGQRLCEDFSRGSAQPIEIALGAVRKGVVGFRAKAGNRSDERQGFDRGDQSRQRQFRPEHPRFRSHEERGIMEAAAELESRRYPAALDQQRHRGLALEEAVFCKPTTSKNSKPISRVIRR